MTATPSSTATTTTTTTAITATSTTTTTAAQAAALSTQIPCIDAQRPHTHTLSRSGVNCTRRRETGREKDGQRLSLGLCKFPLLPFCSPLSTIIERTQAPSSSSSSTTATATTFINCTQNTVHSFTHTHTLTPHPHTPFLPLTPTYFPQQLATLHHSSKLPAYRLHSVSQFDKRSKPKLS